MLVSRCDFFCDSFTLKGECQAFKRNVSLLANLLITWFNLKADVHNYPLMFIM